MKNVGGLQLLGLILVSGALVHAEPVAESVTVENAENNVYCANDFTQTMFGVNGGESKLSMVERTSLAKAYIQGKFTVADGVVQYPVHKFFSKRGEVYKIAAGDLYSEIREMCTLAYHRKKYKQEGDMNQFLAGLKRMQHYKLWVYWLFGKSMSGQKEVEDRYEELRLEKMASRLYAFVTNEDLNDTVVEKVKRNRRKLLLTIQSQNDVNAIVHAAGRALHVEGSVKHRLRRLPTNISNACKRIGKLMTKNKSGDSKDNSSVAESVVDQSMQKKEEELRRISFKWMFNCQA